MTKLRRISRLDAMEDDVVEAITHQYSPTRSGKYNSLNWHMVADYLSDEGESTDYGTLRITADRIGVLNMNRLVPTHILPNFTDELKYGEMTCTDDGHYCFTSEEYDESTGEFYEVKYGCPTQLDGEVAPSEYHLYVDIVSSTDAHIQYRYSSSGNKFFAIPQSLLLVNGNGTEVNYHYDEMGKTDAYLNIVIGNPDASTTTNVLDLQNNALIHCLSGVITRSYGTEDDVQPGFGESFKSAYFGVNTTGHIGSGTGDVDIYFPSTHSTSKTYGLVEFTTDGIAHIGKKNAAGTENSMVARADHTHTASSLKFATVTYSPYSETDLILTSTDLITTMENNVSIKSVNGLVGTIEDGEIPSWSYEKDALDPMVSEKKVSKIISLCGNGVGNKSDETNTSVSVTDSIAHNTFLLANSSSYVTVCSVDELDKSMVLNIARTNGTDKRLVTIKNTLGDKEKNLILLGNDNVGDKQDQLLICSGSTRKYIFNASKPTEYDIDQNTSESFKSGTVLKATTVTDGDVVTINPTFQDLNFGVMYILSNTETVSEKLSLCADTSKTTELPIATVSVKNKMDVSTDGYTGTLDRPVMVNIDLGIAVIPSSTEYPYKVPYGVYAVLHDATATKDTYVFLSNIMVDYDYSLTIPESSEDAAYQRFNVKAMVDPSSSTNGNTSISFVLRYVPGYDSMMASDYKTAGCESVDCYIKTTSLSIAAIK